MFDLITNYLYMYHTNQFVILPTYPDTISDSLNVAFNSETPMLRTSPIFAYSRSGPRSVQITISLQRDLMAQINLGKSTLKMEIGDDYVDTIIKQLQAIALPRYASTEKMVDPPLVAVRFGNEIFCKGVVSGDVTVNYDLPILPNKKYAQVELDFTLNEIEPYDAYTVQREGSFRGLSQDLERKIYKKVN